MKRVIVYRGNCRKRKLYRARFNNRLRRENPEKYYWLKKIEGRHTPFR